MTEYNPRPYESAALSAEEITAQVASAQTFEELITALDAIGPIKNSEGTVYSADELVTTIERIRAVEIVPGSITRAFGLREKVSELLLQALVANTESINHLCDTLTYAVEELKISIKTSDGKEVPTAELIDAVKGLAATGEVPQTVTSRYGLRDKVIALRIEAALDT